MYRLEHRCLCDDCCHFCCLLPSGPCTVCNRAIGITIEKIAILHHTWYRGVWCLVNLVVNSLWLAATSVRPHVKNVASCLNPIENKRKQTQLTPTHSKRWRSYLLMLCTSIHGWTHEDALTSISAWVMPPRACGLRSTFVLRITTSNRVQKGWARGS